MQLRTRKRFSARQRWLSALGVATVATVAMAGCSAGSSKTSASAGPLKIGISLSLTGDFADPGKAAQRGYDLWAQEVNKQGGVLGRKVQLKVVNDASSPDQVVTNYQNLITQDKVDIVFGPFSSLLTIPASRVAKRYGYSFIEPAGGGPKVFEQKLDNLFFVQPAESTKSGNVFVDYILSLPADQRPKTAAYAKLDDPFAAPIADNIKTKFEAAGIKTVYDQTYPSESADLTPIVSGYAAANPDVVVAGTQSSDAFAQVKAMIQLKFNPKWLFMSNGANSPTEFPDKVGAKNTAGVFTTGDWYPGSTVAGSKEFIAAYTAKFGGDANGIDSTSAEAYSAGMLVEQVAKKTGKVDNATIIKTLHSGSWSTLVGELSWGANGAPKGEYLLTQWIDDKLTTVFPKSSAQHAPVAPKPNWAG
ncbi:amino acid ABC transporter substrate-binding protein [Tardiphaga sp.]|uniref:amino acid ABC transporter substrate-binding protein n=1 Tax=Tardiphaga sp. TaxID=1926292 RepID=UPI0026165567|nr:amino acid ABC transporter substrate-binding protein [Tardiphaga sp.]MDB5621414.1 amino acid/amide transporter substrate-binding protein family [Tardiphaga sp.]MDQ1554903.1 branched-chain amino acid transport system substrate-binding protein [Microbacteriaceae bacterium]